MHVVRSSLATLAAVAAVSTAGSFSLPVAAADTPSGPGATGSGAVVSDVTVVPPGPPAPVTGQEFSYIATHDLTVRASQIDLGSFVASIPVPDQYRAANLALGNRFDATVTQALTSPGGCVQVVVDPRARQGNLFDYGFFPLSGDYCS